MLLIWMGKSIIHIKHAEACKQSNNGHGRIGLVQTWRADPRSRAEQCSRTTSAFVQLTTLHAWMYARTALTAGPAIAGWPSGQLAS
jgi:hypothetical protein